MKGLTTNARSVLERFLEKDENGNVKETPYQMFQRVSRNIASVDKKYEGEKSQLKTEKEFLEILSNLEFLPNIPTLANAGKSLQQLSACFVLPIEDYMKGIFESVKDMAMIQKSGGGTGFSFSRLRPKGSFVSETGGIASGPISFMKVFDTATGAIKEGGIRRGANMGILRVDHPDIEEFIDSKIDESLPNFNISVAITRNFMKRLRQGYNYSLIDPATGKNLKKVSPKRILRKISKNAHKNGEPGVVFIDEINLKHPLRNERIEALNPCGEQPLLPYESCCLGSINLSSVTDHKGIDYQRLEFLVRKGVHFLDNVIDASKFPIKEITQKTKDNRKIGLGVMGFADSLIKRRISYSSHKALTEARKIISFIQRTARDESRNLAKKRGSFPNINNTHYKQRIRNATLTTIAPTGTISIIADCSPGIEPLFNVIYTRKTTHGNLLEINPHFKKTAQTYNLNKQQLRDIAKKGTVKHSPLNLKEKKVFTTSHDLRPEQHIRLQSEFQKYTDNSVSKTVNLPKNSRIKDIEDTILLAYQKNCKGLTVYRDKSRKEQVLNLCKRC